MLSREEEIPDDMSADLGPAECRCRHDIHARARPFFEVLRQPDEVEENRSGTELDEYIDVAALHLLLTVAPREADTTMAPLTPCCHAVSTLQTPYFRSGNTIVSWTFPVPVDRTIGKTGHAVHRRARLLSQSTITPKASGSSLRPSLL